MVEDAQEGPKTEKEKADFARYKKYFDNLEAGVAASRWVNGSWWH